MGFFHSVTEPDGIVHGWDLAIQDNQPTEIS